MATCIRCGASYNILSALEQERVPGLCKKCYAQNSKLSQEEIEGLRARTTQRRASNEQRLGVIAMPLWFVTVAVACAICGIIAALIVHYWTIQAYNDFSTGSNKGYNVGPFLLFLISMAVPVTILIWTPLLWIRLFAKEFIPSIKLSEPHDEWLTEVWRMMKKPLSLIGLLIGYGTIITVVVVMFNVGFKSDKKRYVDKNGKFSLIIPNGYQVEVKEKPVHAVGFNKLDTWIWVITADRSESEPLSQEERTRTIKAAKEQLLSKFGITTIEPWQKKYVIDGVEGWGYGYEVPSKGTGFKSVAFEKNNTIFLVSLTSNPSTVDTLWDFIIKGFKCIK